MQLYVSLKINSNIPFPNLIKASNIFQPIFPVALPYINDSVVVSQNKLNQNKTKDAPSLCDKVFRSKKQKLDVCKPRVCRSSGVVFTSPSLWSSPSLDNSWCISSNPCEKTSKHRFSHFFSVGCINSDKQICFLLHIIREQKFI